MILKIPNDTVFSVSDICGSTVSTVYENTDFRVSAIHIDDASLYQGASIRATMVHCASADGLTVLAKEKKYVLSQTENIIIPPNTDYVLSSSNGDVLIYEVALSETLNAFFADSQTPENATKKMVYLPVLEPFEEAVMADSASDQVVISTFLSTDQTKLNVMSYDENQQIGPHSRPFTGWITVLTGNIHFTIGESAYDLSAGNCLLMPANIPHSAKAVGGPAKYQIMVIRS